MRENFPPGSNMEKLAGRTACAGLLLLMLLAGCATPSPRARYLQELQPGNLTNLVAYRSDTNLEIRIPFPAKDAFAHASWRRVEGSTPDYQRQFAVLTF